ncbi:MAG: glucose-1-phosphate cytidylyltransferase [Acidimicrobiales bacterium]
MPDPKQTIILCGGRGTRISEYSSTIPKPLVPIGGRPILWHIMKIYASYGFTDFTLALGWLGEEIRRYFLHYEALTSDFTVELGTGRVDYLAPHPESGWRVTCRDTGLDAQTGTRVRLASDPLGDSPIMVTYGDGLGDIDVRALLDFHHAHGRLATITVVQPPSRFGELTIDSAGMVREFTEKPQTSTGAINGGFMVFQPDALRRYLPEADVMLEREPLKAMAADGELGAYVHDGFWQPMDTPRERALLENLWTSGTAPWKRWA